MIGAYGTINSTEIQQSPPRRPSQYSRVKRQLGKATTYEHNTAGTATKEAPPNRINSDSDIDLMKPRPLARHESTDSISNGISSMFNKLTFGFFGEVT